MINWIIGVIYIFIGFVILGVYYGMEGDDGFIGPEMVMIPLFWPLTVLTFLGYKIGNKYRRK